MEVSRLYDDYRKMLDAVRPDVVCICRPYARNAEACIEAAARSCHIICEKPIATSLDLEINDWLRQQFPPETLRERLRNRLYRLRMEACEMPGMWRFPRLRRRLLPS